MRHRGKHMMYTDAIRGLKTIDHSEFTGLLLIWIFISSRLDGVVILRLFRLPPQNQFLVLEFIFLMVQIDAASITA